ncbi:MAG: aspartate--tRNA(Asn) ligase [Candidatus Ryanbacteria bacterium RIFCSPLOWO2_02_FULL_45_11c]|uniref:Aspartate--tRNA ligase n=1 Tax=Candidatus Ryanbacteria bacterium RIFCSPLOWO2_02_FULL_45_11c TaxID=1802128 RepID=A0A1G2GWJ6_9BACT|nr:MAG: aspartate--tRNA(Asn) ligase [Candidatus Ryanbacteria bacterium RIFCSPLOWO2_02_FULL_45_11c]
MNRTYTQDILKHENQEVTLMGWVDVRRDHGKLLFVDVRDRTGVAQVVFTAKEKELYDQANELRSEWVISVTGIVQKRPDNMKNPNIVTGEVELKALRIDILAKAKELPFEKDTEINLDTYLDNLPLTLRTPRSQALFKVQAEITRLYRDFLTQEGFVEFQAPKLIGEDAEGGANSFSVEYFGHMAHLAQSPQLYKQIMVGVFERVFAVGNVYRAEKHSTTRHINEYTSLDIEMGFIHDHRDVMKLETQLLAHILDCLQISSKKQVALIGATIPRVPQHIPEVKLRDAQAIIKKLHGVDCVNEPDLEPQHERWLCEYAAQEYGSDFIFITHFPVSKRPFYTYEDENDPGYTKGFDLLFRGVEITTGAQRIHGYDTLVASLEKKGLDPEKFRFYLQAFKYGMPPHGGFGMGLERLTAKLLGIENIKEATLFPRDINRIDNLLST